MDLFMTLSIGAAILATSAIIAYKLFRRRHPASVSCWFCGEKCEIPHDQVNSWDCPYCEQYNGFTEDGDYNKSIPAQFCEELNVSSISRSSSSSSLRSSGREAANVLCGSCSRNQLMKIKQLANFVPSTEENFDLEAEAYHHHLEQVYRLCRVCEVNVNHELARQNAAIRAKMKEDEIGQTPQRHQAARDNFQGSWHGGAVKSRSAKVAGILQLVSITCALAILIASCNVAFTRFLHLNLRSVVPPFFERCLEMLADRVVLLLITGAFARILAVFISGLNRLQIVDALSCFNWLVLLLLFFILEDSHIYSRSLLTVRVSLSSVNLVMSVLSALMRCRRSILQVEQISLRVEQEDSNLSQFSDVEQESASPEMPSAADNQDAVSDVPYGEMRMLRLGTPRPKEVRKGFSFELFGNTNGGNTTSTPSLELRPGVGVGQRYPLLSPARFCPSPASVPQRLSYPNGMQQGIIKTSDFSMTGSNGRIAKERVNGLTQRKASQKTKPNGEAPLNVETPKRRSLFGNYLRVVLGVSLGVNLIVILCVFLKFQSVLPIEMHDIHRVVKTFFKSALFS